MAVKPPRHSRLVPSRKILAVSEWVRIYGYFIMISILVHAGALWKDVRVPDTDMTVYSTVTRYFAICDIL